MKAIHYSVIKERNGKVTINEVAIMPHKDTNKYSFVNISRGHICPCVFDSIEDAINDLEEHKKSGKIISYTQISVTEETE